MSKNRQIAVSFSNENFEKIFKIAESREISKAEFIRSLIDIDFEKKRSPRGRKVIKIIDPKLFYQLNKIGINLNQIAKHTNQKKELDIQVLLALNNIEKMMKELL